MGCYDHEFANCAETTTRNGNKARRPLRSIQGFDRMAVSGALGDFSTLAAATGALAGGVGNFRTGDLCSPRARN